VNRAGEITPLTERSGSYGRPRLSPDGKRIALVNGEDIWIHDIERDAMARLTAEGTNNRYPTWSPDGQWVAFSSARGAGGHDLYRQRADFSGPAEVLLEEPYHQFPTSWSPDGKMLIYLGHRPAGKLDIWALPVEVDGEPRVLLETPLWENHAGISPNGRWMAYQSGDSDHEPEVYVRPFPDGGERWPISTGGGKNPLWSPNGHELFYWNGSEARVVEVETEHEFRAGASQLLFEAPPGALPSFDVAPDGEHFLMNLPEEGAAQAQINVVVNWFEELKRLVPTD
jgi:serine/threonine-protein kinase